jgi:hypothetical protein
VNEEALAHWGAVAPKDKEQEQTGLGKMSLETKDVL